MTTLRAITVLVMLVPFAARAQGITPTIGARVRLTAPDVSMRGVTGKVVDMTTDTLFIAKWHGAQPVAIPVDKISRLEVSAGKNRRRGMVWGGVSGLVLGGLMGLSIAGLTRGEGAEGVGSSEDVAILAGTTATITLMGVGYGALMAPDRWQDATLHPPANRGMGAAGTSRIGVSIAF